MRSKVNGTTLPSLTGLQIRLVGLWRVSRAGDRMLDGNSIVWHICGKDANLGNRYVARESTGGHETMTAHSPLN